jgi:hypothetical protein
MKSKHVLPKPDFTKCPKVFCFHWLEQGDLIAQGFYPNVEEANNDMEEVLVERCGWRYGVCLRDPNLQQAEPGQIDPSYKDWYEPCEPRLDKSGLPHDYFIKPKIDL